MYLTSTLGKVHAIASSRRIQHKSFILNDCNLPMYITLLGLSVNDILLKYIFNIISLVKMLHWNFQPRNPVELSPSYALECSLLEAEHMTNVLCYAHTRISLLVTDMVYKPGSVSDLLDYINPNHDAKGSDGAVKRKSYITKVCWSLDHGWSK